MALARRSPNEVLDALVEHLDEVPSHPTSGRRFVRTDELAELTGMRRTDVFQGMRYLHKVFALVNQLPVTDSWQLTSPDPVVDYLERRQGLFAHPELEIGNDALWKS